MDKNQTEIISQVHVTLLHLFDEQCRVIDNNERKAELNILFSFLKPELGITLKGLYEYFGVDE